MLQGTAASYRVFVRNWWRWDRGPGDHPSLLPDPGARKTTIARHCTEDEARSIAQRYNACHEPGSLGRKAEFEQE